MTLNRLKKLVDELVERGEGDLNVIMAKDPNGDSGFSPFYDYSHEIYFPETVGKGDIGVVGRESSPNAIVLWPVN